MRRPFGIYCRNRAFAWVWSIGMPLGPPSRYTWVLVSDNNPWRAHIFRKNPQATGITYPRSLLAELSKLLPLPERTKAMDILSLPFFDDLTTTDRSELSAMPALLETALFIYQSDRFAAASATHVLGEKAPAFVAVCMSGIDNLSHVFSKRPGVVDGYYEFVDAMVGKILAETDENTTVLIVSDHGWEYERGKRFGHTFGPPGVLIMKGPPVRPGASPSRVPSISDVAPTILSLMGLPVSRAMDGQVIEEALTPLCRANRSPRFLNSYGPYSPPEDVGGPLLHPPAVEETLRKLRGLGYVK